MVDTVAPMTIVSAEWIRENLQIICEAGAQALYESTSKHDQFDFQYELLLWTRLQIDYKNTVVYNISVNPNLKVDDRPLLLVEELFFDASGGDKITKIDLSQAYLQLEAEEDDQEIPTLNTHKGLYRPV